MFNKKTVLLILFCSIIVPPAFAENIIGRLKKVTGSGRVIRHYEQVTAKNGVGIMLGDQLVTGSDGAMGVIFTDNTRISLGPDSRIKIDRYIYNPKKGLFSFLINKLRGTASYISGIIGKLAPDSVRVQTPTAVIGIRGTFFLIKVKSMNRPVAKDMFVLMPDPEEGKVGGIAVKNDVGSIRLSKACESVQIAKAQQPEHPVILSEQEIQEIFQAALQAVPELENKQPLILFALIKDFPDALREATLQAAPELENKENFLIPFVLMKGFSDAFREVISDRAKSFSPMDFDSSSFEVPPDDAVLHGETSH